MDRGLARRARLDQFAGALRVTDCGYADRCERRVDAGPGLRPRRDAGVARDHQRANRISLIVNRVVGVWALADAIAAPRTSKDTYPQVTTGPYRFVRHPIYTAYLFLFAGGLASLGSPVAVAVLFLSAWRFYKPRMASEDKILEEQFGDAWRNYAAKTPSRLLPFVV